MHAYNGFVLFNIFGGMVNRWVLLMAMIVGMCCAAYAIHRLVEARLGPRLKRALLRLADAADRRPGARRHAVPGRPPHPAGLAASGSMRASRPAAAGPATAGPAAGPAAAGPATAGPAAGPGGAGPRRTAAGAGLDPVGAAATRAEPGPANST
jgi:hypothetical protein